MDRLQLAVHRPVSRRSSQHQIFRLHLLFSQPCGRIGVILHHLLSTSRGKTPSHRRDQTISRPRNGREMRTRAEIRPIPSCFAPRGMDGASSGRWNDEVLYGHGPHDDCATTPRHAMRHRLTDDGAVRRNMRLTWLQRGGTLTDGMINVKRRWRVAVSGGGESW